MDQPNRDDFIEWAQHPVTEWVMGVMTRHAGAMQGKWADMAWKEGVVDPQALVEAKVRAHCYQEIPNSTYDDWKVIDDTAG